MIGGSKICLVFCWLLLPVFFLFFTNNISAQVSLSADPIEVKAGNGFGSARIRWRTEGAEEVALYTVKPDGSLKLLDRGRAGEHQDYEIFPNQTYEYRLYAADKLENPLATITVAGSNKVNYLPDFQVLYRKIVKPWTLQLIVIFLLLLAARGLARRGIKEKLRRNLILVAVGLAILSAAVVIGRVRGLPFENQGFPDSTETIDAARQMFLGNGYVVYLYGEQPQPPRYAPGFSIALLPFMLAGEYPANVIFGGKFFALLYFGIAVFAAWKFGGRLGAMLAAIFIGVSPFAESYARIIMSETLTAALIVLIAVLLWKPSVKNAIFAGAIAGVLVLVRLQLIICLPALLLALPQMRQRIWAMASASPFLLAHGIYNWRAFGSFFKTGYDYWLPGLKPFALEYVYRIYPQGDGPWIINDVLRGWLLIWICPCENGGVLSALPNIIFYPLVLLGAFWLFAPPFVTGYGLWAAIKKRREPWARFTLLFCAVSVLFFTFYFYETSRFMAAPATLLLIFAAVGLGNKLERLIEPDSGDGFANRAVRA